MSHSQQTPAPHRHWTKPRLERIGTIADVTGTGTVLNQTPGNAKS